MDNIDITPQQNRKFVLELGQLAHPRSGVIVVERYEEIHIAIRTEFVPQRRSEDRKFADAVLSTGPCKFNYRQLNVSSDHVVSPKCSIIAKSGLAGKLMSASRILHAPVSR